MNIINEQINAVLEDLELMTNPYERSMVRTHLISALSGLTLGTTLDTMANSLPKGKDAIKADIPKEQVEPITEPVPVDLEQSPIEPEQPIVFEEPAQEEKPKAKKSSKKKAEPVEVDVDPNTEEPAAVEPMIVQVEDEDGNAVDLDITEAYGLINTEMSDEDKVELATTIAGYSLVPIYAQLTNLSDGDLKVTLAYQMQQVGLDDINGFINDLTDGQFSDVFEFVNDDNLEYLTSSIEEAMTDEE